MKSISEEELQSYVLDVFSLLHNTPSIGNRINQMQWRVLRLPAQAMTLLTSDRPIELSALGKTPSYICIPIGPRAIFLAFDPGFRIQELLNVPTDRLVKAINKRVVSSASKFVYGIDEEHFEFIKKHLASNTAEPIIAKAFRKAKNKDV